MLIYFAKKIGISQRSRSYFKTVHKKSHHLGTHEGIGKYVPGFEIVIRHFSSFDTCLFFLEFFYVSALVSAGVISFRGHVGNN